MNIVQKGVVAKEVKEEHVVSMRISRSDRISEELNYRAENRLPKS
jgi:hypothetical protein